MLKQNLIFIVIDGLRKDFMLQYGKNGFKKFINEGIFLNNLIVHAPETYLSIGTFLTGLYPTKHKCSLKRWEDDSVKHIYDYLKNDNYKFLIHGAFNPFGLSYTEDYYNNFGKLSEEICKKTMMLNPDISETLKFIKSCDDKPFFIYNHFFTLRKLEKNMDDRVDKCCERGDIEKVINSYIECLKQVDIQIERLFDFIKEILSNTLIIITADHGESFRLYDNHILGDTGIAWNLHNGSRYDEAINVPMIITGLNLSKDKIISSQIRQVDVFPTILKLLNYDYYLQPIDGESLNLYDEIKAKNVIVFSTSETKKQAIRTTDNWKLIFDAKLIELFDLNNDFKEQNNLAETRKDKVRQVFSLLSEFPTEEIITKKELIFRYTDYKNIEYVDTLFKQLGLLEEWDRRAATYNNISWVNNEEYLTTIKNMLDISNKDIMLEVGCGTAVIADFFSKYAKKVYGIDQSPAMLKISKNSNLDLRVGTADNLPFPNNFFDKIVMRMVLHHLELDEIDKVMHEIKRVLKPNGLFFLSEGVSIKDDLIESFKAFLIEKEDRIFFTSQELINIVSKYFILNKKQDFILKQQSIANWLDNSSTDSIRREKIYKKHRDDSEMIYKDMANFTYLSDDVLVDMRHFLIVGEKNDIQ